MKLFLYVFLLIHLTAHSESTNSSSLSKNTGDDIEKITPVNIIATTTAKKESDANVVFNTNSQTFNKWELFNSWSCNTPQVFSYGSTQLFINSSVKPQKYLYRILVFGGSLLVRDRQGTTRKKQNTTWIYYEETNSWKTIGNGSNGPPAITFPYLVTLCSSHAIVLNADTTNNTWIFVFEKLDWKRVTIVGDRPHPFEPRRNSFVAVTVSSSNFSCSCSDDVLVFGYASILHSVETIVWYRLSCVVEHTTYRWEKVGHRDFFGDRISLDSITASPERRTLYFIVEKCVWTFSVEKSIWNETGNCMRNTFASYRPHDLDIKPVFVPETREFVSFSLVRRLISRVSLSNTTTSYEDIVGLSPDIRNVYAVRVFGGGKVIVYLSEGGQSCGSSKWILQRYHLTRVWAWSKLSNTILVPVNYALQSLWKNTYYRIAVGISDGRITSLVGWSLDMRTKMWQLTGRFDIKGIDVNDTASWLFGKSTHMQGNVWLIVSEKYATLITSNEYVQQMAHRLPPRFRFSVVTINSSSALLFGGVNEYSDALKDLSEFSLTLRMWKRLETIENEWNVPSARYDHTAAVMGFDMFVVGGTNDSRFCYDEVWIYNLINNSWSILKSINNGPPFSLTENCDSNVVARAGMLWIAAVFRRRPFDIDFGRFQVWTYIAHLQTWRLVTAQEGKSTPRYTFYSLTFWQNILLSLGDNKMFYMNIGCPRGLASSDISRVVCAKCNIGFFADVGSMECRQCPSGTTTRGEGSSTASDCNVCVSGYCVNGRCFVMNDNSTQVPVCMCTVGFTGSQCQYATYYYVGMGIVLFVGILSVSFAVVRRIIRKRREHESALRRHIKLLNDAWQISWQEVRLQNEIGGGASGRVWKAQYRDMEVAVKMLICEDDPISSLEFAREIKFMQTIRHRNIVLFIGAGKTSPQEQPFLVVEFAHRGSLRHVLDDVSIDMSPERKISFALDASKGMEFLHNLDPPRIHRDLKSDNLLVSRSWIVKVADFGFGIPLRCIKRRETSSAKKSLISNSSLNVSLLDVGEICEYGIGTVRYRAPEMSRRQSYDGSIDVYRYTHCVSFICVHVQSCLHAVASLNAI